MYFSQVLHLIFFVSKISETPRAISESLGVFTPSTMTRADAGIGEVPSTRCFFVAQVGSNIESQKER